MKCADCSKDIPDGFTECPWCGASRSAIPAALSLAMAPSNSLTSSSNTLLAWLSSSLSLFLVLVAARAATFHKFGFVSLEDSGYFIGVCFGPYVVAAILVFGYFWLARKDAHYSSKLLAISGGASLFAVLSLAQTMQAPVARLIRTPARVAAALPTNPNALPTRPATIWDSAIRSTFTDIGYFNDQYLAEISKLDSSALPLYTPESFRDAATVQQMLAQLHARLAVAEKFSNPEASIGKLKDYVAAVDATDADKQKFLTGFAPPMDKCLQLRKIAATRERDWLHASIDLYEFAQTNQSFYVYTNRKVFFTRNDLPAQFGQRLQKAARLRNEFLQAQQNFLRGQSFLLAQQGLRPSDLDAPASTSAPANSPPNQ
jgi:hypothetical protein